jgi:hypothetical protein
MLPCLHLPLGRRHDAGLCARSLERGLGFRHLDLLEAFGNEDCDFLSLKSIARHDASMAIDATPAPAKAARVFDRSRMSHAPG